LSVGLHPRRHHQRVSRLCQSSPGRGCWNVAVRSCGR
jgi:hypothetical protein